MTDDQRLALERLRRVEIGGEPIEQAYRACPSPHMAYYADVFHAARLALAEHPADDEKPSRWAVYATATASGKTQFQFQCTECGRLSVTPDKTCPMGCGYPPDSR